MPAADRQYVLERLRTWLVRANPEIADIDVDSRTDIIEARLLESLQVVEFILFLEAESGRTILSESLDPNDLRTLDSIYSRFFAELA